MKTAVYISTIHKIGGVEAFAINLCNRTGFDLIFDKADFSQLKKLKSNYYQLNHCKKEYDVLILASAWGKTPDNIKAKKYVQVIHADLKEYIENWNFTYNKLPYTTHHVCVGQNVKKSFEEITDYKCDKVIYNLLDKSEIPNNPKNDKLSFITLSRFSKEKGFERILQMAELMKNEDYVWNIYGDTSTPYAKIVIPKLKKYSQINILGITNQAKDELVKHHYLVQLSDTEGFPYSIYESLQCKVPVISTNFPAVYELIEDGKNGYILDMELNNFDINKIKSVPLINSFKEKSTENDWFEFLESVII